MIEEKVLANRTRFVLKLSCTCLFWFTLTRRTTQVNVNQNKQVQINLKTNLVILANIVSSIIMYFY